MHGSEEVDDCECPPSTAAPEAVLMSAKQVARTTDDIEVEEDGILTTLEGTD